MEEQPVRAAGKEVQNLGSFVWSIELRFCGGILSSLNMARLFFHSLSVWPFYGLLVAMLVIVYKYIL